MDCPVCGVALPAVTDPTQREVRCPGCGGSVDLAVVSDSTQEIGSPSDDPLVGRIIGDGRYRIEERLGQGGMGTVYLGTQISLGRPVAIKVLASDLTQDETFVRRFRREAGTLAAFQHPHVVTVHDTGQEEGVHYIVMSYVAGPSGGPMSLRDLLRSGPMGSGQALRIVAQVCAGLAYAHERGIVHRDIKPGNILLDERGDGQIADFGIARVTGAGVDSGLTVTGSSMGTLLYMAPEQRVDATRCDARTDVYSLGVVFYEMLVGEVPEGRFDMPSALRPEIDPRIDAIIERAMRREPEKRYSSATDMGRAVHETLSTAPPVAAAPPPPPVPPPPPAGAAVAHPPPPAAPPVPAAPPRRKGSLLSKLLWLLIVAALLVAIAALGDPESLDLIRHRTYEGFHYTVTDEDAQVGLVAICAGVILVAGVFLWVLRRRRLAARTQG